MRSRSRIIDAVQTLIGQSGFSGVSIASAAQAAGVTRQTIYSIFGSREELVSQAVAEHLTDIVRGLQEQLGAATTPTGYVVDLIVACRTIVRTDPVLRALLLHDANNPLFDSGALERARAVGIGLLSPMEELFPYTDEQLADIADFCIHLGWSAICFDAPSARSDAELDRFLTRWLTPAFANLTEVSASDTGTH
ncbi:TetR/AcrR family transcriptional regulator [Millisia brevis]|uniref:TetR/AcrR family transcriptional regulator n=1 Tax=Millisia brevis TaxID=264148 RepID=UPI00082DBAAF|nr:TetR/AcrR family transcriptional regulator [Millisia brevis]